MAAVAPTYEAAEGLSFVCDVAVAQHDCVSVVLAGAGGINPSLFDFTPALGFAAEAGAVGETIPVVCKRGAIVTARCGTSAITVGIGIMPDTSDPGGVIPRTGTLPFIGIALESALPGEFFKALVI